VSTVEPQNLDAEESVLGACLQSERAIDKASEFLEPSHFYRSAHGTIFAALLSLRRRNEPIEAVLVGAELERLGALKEVGGPARIAELVRLQSTATNVAHYAALVLETARGRTVYRSALAIQKAAQNGGLTMHPELGDEMRRALDEAAILPGEPALPPGPLFISAHEFAASHFEPPEPLLGTEESAILAVGGLGLLAGRPGTGKTTLVLDLCCHLAAGIPWPPVDEAASSNVPLPWPCPRALNVAVIVNEGPQEMFRAKVQDKLTRFPHSIREAGGSIFIQTFNWGTFSFADRSIHERLRGELEEREIDLVVGDPLGSLGLEGVGSPAETLGFVNLLKPLGLGTHRSFLFLHHFRERVEKGEDEVARLSGAWGGHLDTLITLSAGSQKNQSRLAYPKLRWSSLEPASIILARIINTRGFEAIGEEGDAAMLEPLIHEYLATSRAEGLGLSGWQTADAIRTGISARRVAVTKALEGAPHLFALAIGQEAKDLGAKSGKAKLWGLREWDREAKVEGQDEVENSGQTSLADDEPSDDIPW
jgi:hypothetical protein